MEVSSHYAHNGLTCTCEGMQEVCGVCKLRQGLLDLMDDFFDTAKGDANGCMSDGTSQTSSSCSDSSSDMEVDDGSKTVKNLDKENDPGAENR